ncbi:TATA box-binding protein-associated factor RNA polymerase I subunit A-like [Sinocyclocheilus rhinocerous]|uniref:TATA box-binding protein-associated factor RNA polymerase I subunit A-like n=1 Tax=Sinocyclocheilus rhinocerous TaxID=307959 RepID=UPI0007B9AD32|nr:PREDICTED: TATA box-binding protein-associated factor RNA polymerase I subunit A-like [Sinocyclocheilus rhinocerous]
MDDIETELNIAAARSDSPEDKDRNQEQIKQAVLLHQSQPDPRGLFTAIDFLKSNRKCLKLIREAMLRHNWQEAARYFSSYIQTLEAGTHPQVRSAASEITWRLGTEILRHLPNSSLDDFNAFYEQLKNFGVRNYSKICLEHCFHLMLNGQMDEAKRQLSIADSWRYGKQSNAQSMTKKLIRSYCGYLDYLIWNEKKTSALGSEEECANREMHSYFRQASVTLKEIVSQPGVWDPFVLSYIHMLEFYEDKDVALQVLENYAYNKEFPLNPNAHVYLYQFLKRHKAPRAKLIGSLRILHSLVPSHELMLELCSLLLHTKQMSDLEEALAVSMDLLEFSSWKCSIKAWKCLLNIMKKLKMKKCINTVRKEWNVRRSLWLSLHYRSYIARRDSLQNVQLLMVKRDVLRFTGENNRDYFKIALRVERASKPKPDRLGEKRERMATMKSKKKEKKTLSD